MIIDVINFRIFAHLFNFLFYFIFMIIFFILFIDVVIDLSFIVKENIMLVYDCYHTIETDIDEVNDA
jgi:hypothetical protein